MKIDRISLKNKTVTDDERQGANHLAEQQSRRMHPSTERFDEYRRLSRTVRTDDDSDAAEKGHPVFNLELINENHSDAKYSNDDGNYFPCGDTFTWQKYPGEQKAEYGDRSLKHGGESRGNILLGPKYGTVVQSE